MLATSSTTLWYTTRATGIVALVLLTVTMVLGILTAGRVGVPSWPAFAQADLHKRVSLLAMVFLASTSSPRCSTPTSTSAGPRSWCRSPRPTDPSGPGSARWASTCMVAVAVSSALRQRISARTWRGIHWLAYGSWPVAMAHALGEGTDALKLWMDAVAAPVHVAVGGALAWRIADHRRSRDAGPVGAVRRPGWSHPAAGPPVRRCRRRPGSPLVPIGPTAHSPECSTDATRLLEKDRP